MPVLAAAGFHVLAPGPGVLDGRLGAVCATRMTSERFLFLNASARTFFGLVFAFSGYRSVAALVGHNRDGSGGVVALPPV